MHLRRLKRSERTVSGGLKLSSCGLWGKYLVYVVTKSWYWISFQMKLIKTLIKICSVTKHGNVLGAKQVNESFLLFVLGGVYLIMKVKVDLSLSKLFFQMSHITPRLAFWLQKIGIKLNVILKRDISLDVVKVWDLDTYIIGKYL